MSRVPDTQRDRPVGRPPVDSLKVSSPKSVREPAPDRSPVHSTPSRQPSNPPSSGTPILPRVIEGGLRKLIESMKSTFFPQGNEESLRLTILSAPSMKDPCMIFRGIEGTLLLGTGFSEIASSGIHYQAFPDMRLPYSERDRMIGWILLQTGFDIRPFQMILEVLGFPHVYGTRDVIAYIRENIQDPVFLDKCRFFELFSPGILERKIGEYTLADTQGGLAISTPQSGIFLPSRGNSDPHSLYPTLSTEDGKYKLLAEEPITFTSGEIIDLQKKKITKHFLKFTFDTFYIDKNSIGVAAGYTLSDRTVLSENGVLTFVLEEDVHARAIVGHIFIDSRGFVHSQEMMGVHKEILKGIRYTYEQAILANPRIERSELVHTLRRELTKYCYLVTGRTPVVMPVIIER